MKLFHSKAFTLMEVIMASAVASIIVLGIISSNVTLQKTRMDASNTYYLSQGTINTLNHMMTSASLAVGTLSRPGILVGTNWGGSWNVSGVGAKSVCIHQNVNPLATSNDIWPGTVDLTKDRWSCYTYLPTNWSAPADTRYPGTVYWCTMTYTAVAPYYGATDCTSGSANIKALSKASRVQASLTTSTAMFNVEIKNCLNNNSETVPNSSMTNPCVTKSSGINPPGQSAG